MREMPRSIKFFRTGTGEEPVRDWLRELPKLERKIVGEDIKVAQETLYWKRPLVGSLGGGLWEVRSSLPSTIARVLFAEIDGKMILLHAFKKTTQKTPIPDLELTLKRKKQYENDPQ